MTVRINEGKENFSAKRRSEKLKADEVSAAASGFPVGRAMLKTVSAILSLFAFAAITSNAQGQPAEPVEGGAAVRSLAAMKPLVRVIARLRTPPSVMEREFTGPALSNAQQSLIESMRGVNVPYADAIPGLPLVVLEVGSSQLESLLASGRITAIEEDHIDAAYLAQSVPLINADDAWAQGARGAGQAVAVLDTGVDRNHAFLTGRIVDEACFSSNSPANGATTVCPNGQTTEIAAGAAAPCGLAVCDHGTHVAGIAAGRGANVGDVGDPLSPSSSLLPTPFSGVAPDANVIAVQVFSRFTDAPLGPMTCANRGLPSPCVLTFGSDQIRGLQHVRNVAANRAVAAVNMSLGGGSNTTACDSDSRKTVIDQLRSDDIATVIASGNDGFTNAVGAPGCISTAVTVGSTTKTDAISTFSNSGVMVDLLAPGSSINSSVTGGGFGVKNGTSMATPHVAGAFAALRSAVPGATADQIEAALVATGVQINDARNNICRRRIDVLAALNTLRSPVTPYWPRFMADVNADGRADYCRFVGNAPDVFLSCAVAKADNTFGNYDVNGNPGFPGNFDPGYPDRPHFMADVNADGRADYCRFVGNDPDTILSCALAKADNTFGNYDVNGIPGNFDPGYSDRPRFMADVNADGRADYCRFVGNDPNTFLSCALAKADSTFGNYDVNGIPGNFDPGYPDRPRFMADANADGRADYCRFVGNDPNTFLSCALAKADSTFGNYDVNGIPGNFDPGYSDRSRFMADVNADGRADYCRFVGNDPNTFLSCALAKADSTFGNYDVNGIPCNFDPGYPDRPG
jgi:subtilisin family serine protease